MVTRQVLFLFIRAYAVSLHGFKISGIMIPAGSIPPQHGGLNGLDSVPDRSIYQTWRKSKFLKGYGCAAMDAAR